MEINNRMQITLLKDDKVRWLVRRGSHLVEANRELRLSSLAINILYRILFFTVWNGLSRKLLPILFLHKSFDRTLFTVILGSLCCRLSADINKWNYFLSFHFISPKKARVLSTTLSLQITVGVGMLHKKLNASTCRNYITLCNGIVEWHCIVVGCSAVYFAFSFRPLSFHISSVYSFQQLTPMLWTSVSKRTVGVRTEVTLFITQQPKHCTTLVVL